MHDDYGHSHARRKNMNVNTGLNLFLVALISTLGYLGKGRLEAIEKKQDSMMPRSEIELRLQIMDKDNSRISADLLATRTEQSRQEIDLERLKIELQKKDGTF